MVMVGLSVVLETKSSVGTKLTQVINKATNISVMANYNDNNMPPPPPPPLPLSYSCPNYSYYCFPLPPFLDQCFLCAKKLSHGTDIYMYKGDRAFCSEECRYEQIFMDEDVQKKSNTNNNCSLTAATGPTPSSSTSASSGSSRHKKGASRNRVGGFFY